MKLFKPLAPEEEAKFRAWAREHYKPFTSISGVWHPVVQAECAKINQEADLDFSALAVDMAPEK